MKKAIFFYFKITNLALKNTMIRNPLQEKTSTLIKQIKTVRIQKRHYTILDV